MQLIWKSQIKELSLQRDSERDRRHRGLTVNLGEITEITTRQNHTEEIDCQNSCSITWNLGNGGFIVWFGFGNAWLSLILPSYTGLHVLVGKP